VQRPSTEQPRSPRGNPARPRGEHQPEGKTAKQKAEEMLQRVRAKERAAACRKDEPQPASEDTARSVGRPVGRSVGRSVGKKHKRVASSESSKAAKTTNEVDSDNDDDTENGLKANATEGDSDDDDDDTENGLKANATECTASCYDLSATASGPATMQDSGREHGNSMLVDDHGSSLSDDDIFPCGICSAIIPEPVLLCSHCRCVECPKCRQYQVCDGCDAWICQPCLTEHRQLCRTPPIDHHIGTANLRSALGLNALISRWMILAATLRL